MTQRGEFRRKLRGAGNPRAEVTGAQRDLLQSDAARLRFSRQLRRRLFGAAIFGEAAWDILLALYTTKGSAQSLGAADLADVCASPFSTTLRWLDYLEEVGLVNRISGDGGRRVIGAELTREGRQLLDSYFVELREADVFGP